ncbi:MAG: PAS domain S-box protein [Deltaproteobacteria bacterium]|nr:PAS domain S-box protein [Deltaproteobacteria bacterium]
MKKAASEQPQEGLSKIEDRYRTFNRNLFEALPVGLALALMDGTLVDINPAYATIIGRTIEETKKLTYWDITPEKYTDQEQQQLKSLTETGKYGPYEKEYIHKDGHLVSVRLQGKMIERDGIKYIWSSVEDISDRKRVEKELQWKSNLDAALAALYSPLISPSSTIVDIALIIKIQAQKLTESTQCYVGSIDPNKSDLITHTLSEMMRNGQCAVLHESNRRITFPKGKDAKYGRLWGFSLNKQEAFYTNDAQNHSESRGTPEGHIKIEKFLSIPVMLEQQLVGQISLANPSRDYTDQDLVTGSRLAEFFALAIQKLRFEEDMKSRAEELEIFNKSMVDREMRIVELKKEINKLSEELNRPVRFPEFWEQKEN